MGYPLQCAMEKNVMLQRYDVMIGGPLHEQGRKDPQNPSTLEQDPENLLARSVADAVCTATA
jgi:hypothetical protein